MLTRSALFCRWPRSTSLTVAATVAFLCAGSPVHAAEDKTIDSVLSASGALTFRTLTITKNGVLSALPYVAGSTTSTGVLDITADTIIIEAGGVISADGAGYQGVDQAAGACAPAAASCAQAGSSPGAPGGGGGFYAAGGDGSSEASAGVCVDLANGAAGGPVAYSSGAMLLGSAGGSANLGSSMHGGPGGAGGGYIRLAAAVIQIDGSVHANGVSPESPHYGGVGPGGGSGGVVEITAATLRGAGNLSVIGGDGAHGTGLLPSGSPNNGGGGAGGVILLHLPPEATSPLTSVENGGRTGDCTSPTTSAAAGMQLYAAMAMSCVDLDMDGFSSSQCGGDDCDDTDPAIHPDAGTCPAPDAGTMSDGGAHPTNRAEYLQYGGACATAPSSPLGLASFGAGLAAALGLVMLRATARGRRRRRS